MLNVFVKRLHPEAQIPEFANSMAAGFDLRAVEHEAIFPAQIALIPTGLAFEIPPDHEIQIRPRSGLALKHGVTVFNSPGTIDADYRGEVGVLLYNASSEIFFILPGDRIAQGVLNAVPRASIIGTQNLTATERGASGFGSTGVK